MPAPGPSRLRRYLLLELPAWMLVGVSVAYAIGAGGSRFAAYFQLSLLVSAVAWLVGGRMANLTLGSLLFGGALGTMALFNFLIGDFAGIPLGALLLPVTIYLAVVLVLLESGSGWRNAVTALAGVVLSAAVQLLALGILRST
ncbi:MAG: hypothetical protein E6J46_01045 [Chloroflexi bacterium]|nr:MAG: hypothetical protein E6J46_01045 [Chloroflexota bacterium]